MSNPPQEPKYCGAFYEDLLDVPGLYVISKCPACLEMNKNVLVANHSHKLQISGIILFVIKVYFFNYLLIITIDYICPIYSIYLVDD